ncbi:putative o-methyl transferase b protein [Botrytis fragariae]|uniref:Putative o-methyl transferase b protein n=1 Tax=Botrytis fragariae TaxID=1964551 RepID=A0A8H6EGY3_9HELO|nr:putative o-methyl transferase b protein [Botrytis fragariae]KAF5871803.1 putative o-methyl transferase b protein [Botrytis fragariae]
MDDLITHVKAAAANADEAGRKKIIDGLRDLSIELETPWDSMQRIMYLQFQLTGAQIGCDMKLFEIMAAKKEPMNVEQLAKETESDPAFLVRLLRYLASVRMIRETGKNTFEASKVTEALAQKGYKGGIGHYFHSLGPTLQATPDYLAERKYQNITDNTCAPAQIAFKTEIPYFYWIQEQPRLINYFADFMVGQRGEMPTWLSKYPIEEETKDWNPKEPVFVDVGGGFGHKCLELRMEKPNVPGRVILQELDHAIKNALPMKDVELEVHDFFTPQIVIGAKYYYLRNIIHDYADEKCRIILKHLKDAMGLDSAILIDEMVIPETGAHWHATQIDLVMMTVLASTERTEGEWLALLASVGLQAKRIVKYTASLGDSIIVAVPV